MQGQARQRRTCKVCPEVAHSLAASTDWRVNRSGRAPIKSID